MRFVMAEPVLSAEEVLTLLSDLGVALGAFVAVIDPYRARTPLAGRHPALALHHGIAVHCASLDWVRAAIAALTPGSQRPPHDPPP
jgi:hypothetical protein